MYTKGLLCGHQLNPSATDSRNPRVSGWISSASKTLKLQASVPSNNLRPTGQWPEGTHYLQDSSILRNRMYGSSHLRSSRMSASCIHQEQGSHGTLIVLLQCSLSGLFDHPSYQYLRSIRNSNWKTFLAVDYPCTTI